MDFLEVDEIIDYDDHTEHVRQRYEEQRKMCPELYEKIERLVEALAKKINDDSEDLQIRKCLLDD